MTVEREYEQRYVERDDARLGIRVYDPDPHAPLLALWPAMGVPARNYTPLARELVGTGLSVAVADLRGTGDSTPAPSRRCRYGLAELVRDVGAVLDSLQPQHPGRPVILAGHSLGGHAALLHLATTPSPASGVALIASGTPHYRNYGVLGGLGVLAFTQSLAAASAVLGVWPGIGFGGRQARGVIRDWAHVARTGRFPRLGGVDVEQALGAVHHPVLAVTVEGDTYTPPATTEQLCGKLAAGEVRWHHHYTSTESGRPMDHFRWVGASAFLATRIRAFADTLTS